MRGGRIPRGDTRSAPCRTAAPSLRRSACPSARPRTLPCPARRSRRVPHHAAVAGEIVAAELRRLGGIGRRGAEREQALERRLEHGVQNAGESEAPDHFRQESEAAKLGKPAGKEK